MMDRFCRALKLTERLLRKNKLAHSFALLSVVGLAATGTFAVEDTAKLSGIGLKGIFPSTPPADLSDSEFAKLDGNWADWSKGTATTVAEFYSSLENSDSAAQRRDLGKLKVKLDVMRRALDDSRYASLHPTLAALYDRLALRIEFAEAALDTLEIDGGQVAGSKAKARSSELLAAIGAVEADLATVTNGQLWLPYFNISELKTSLQTDPLSPAALDAAKKTQNTLQTRDYLLDVSQKEFSHRPALNGLANAVQRYLSAASWNKSSEASQNLRTEFKNLSDLLDGYASTGENASGLRQAFARTRFVSADGGDRLAASMQNRLFNYNLRILASEDFLNRMMSQNRSETGPVRDCVLGAAVSGCQVTNTSVSVDLKPSNTTARFDLRLDGNINSNTQGVTPQATVWTLGNHRFTATKEINFDGTRFSTLPASISVNPHNTTTGIATKVSGVPILGRIANRIASGQVEAKRGEAEAIAASRVQDGVLPRFNSEVDANFAQAGDRINNELYSGLRASNLFPDAFAYQSTDRLLTLNARVMSENQVGADNPDSNLMNVTGAKAVLHESIVNNTIDQMGLAGQTLTEAELRSKIETFLTNALNRQFHFDPPPEEANESGEEKSLQAIIFAAKDPVRIRIQNNEMLIIIRAGFKQEGKDDIPMREITVPLQMTVVDKSISITRGNVVVAAAEDGGGFAVNSVVRKKIQSVLPDRVVDGKIQFKTPEKTMVAYVSDIKLADGWAYVSID